MIPDKVLEAAKRKSKLFKMPVHILNDGMNYFSVLDINIGIVLDSDYYPDKKVYTTVLYSEN